MAEDSPKEPDDRQSDGDGKPPENKPSAENAPSAAAPSSETAGGAVPADQSDAKPRVQAVEAPPKSPADRRREVSGGLVLGFTAIATLAEVYMAFGKMWAAIFGVGLIASLVILFIAKPWKSWVTLWIAVLTVVIIGVVVFIFNRFQSPEPPIPPAPPGPVKVDIEEVSFADPDVELKARKRDETMITFSWRILRKPPRDETYFIGAELFDVDPTNPHNDFYAWRELKDDDSLTRDFGDRDKGTVRVVRVFRVDEACADYLRKLGPDKEHSKRLCDKGGQAESASVGYKVTVN